MAESRSQPTPSAATARSRRQASVLSESRCTMANAMPPESSCGVLFATPVGFCTGGSGTGGAISIGGAEAQDARHTMQGMDRIAGSRRFMIALQHEPPQKTSPIPDRDLDGDRD